LSCFLIYTLSPFFTDELNKRSGIIKSLTQRLKFLESQQNGSKTAFENTQQKFEELSLKVTDATAHSQALEVGVDWWSDSAVRACAEHRWHL